MKIESKQAYYVAMAEMEELLMKGLDNLTEAEDMRLDELSDAIEAWEDQIYPMPLRPDLRAILAEIMEQQKFNQLKMAEALSISASMLSGILKGKKEPNIVVLKNLHEKFQVDGNRLLESV